MCERKEQAATEQLEDASLAAHGSGFRTRKSRTLDVPRVYIIPTTPHFFVLQEREMKLPPSAIRELCTLWRALTHVTLAFGRGIPATVIPRLRLHMLEVSDCRGQDEVERQMTACSSSQARLVCARTAGELPEHLHRCEFPTFKTRELVQRRPTYPERSFECIWCRGVTIAYFNHPGLFLGWVMKRRIQPCLACICSINCIHAKVLICARAQHGAPRSYVVVVAKGAA